MYEVVGCENGPSSTSTKFQEEKQTLIPNASAQENAVTSASTTVQEENLTLIKEPFIGKGSTQDYLIKMLMEDFNQDGKAPASFTAQMEW